MGAQESNRVVLSIEASKRNDQGRADRYANRLSIEGIAADIVQDDCVSSKRRHVPKNPSHVVVVCCAKENDYQGSGCEAAEEMIGGWHLCDPPEGKNTSMDRKTRDAVHDRLISGVDGDGGRQSLEHRRQGWDPLLGDQK